MNDHPLAKNSPAQNSPAPSSLARREFLRSLAAGGLSCAAVASAQVPGAPLREPVHRVAKANTAVPPPNGEGRHPLDAALDMAREALVHIERDITDYTCRMIKQERIRGELQPKEFVDAKIRNRKLQDGKIVVPLSVYMKFVAPANIAGREVVWVEHKNGNKLRAHEGGTAGRFLPSVWLDPDGPLAMRGQLHPIYDVGIENLVIKLIERGERERKFAETDVKFIPGAKINGRVCTVLQVIHPVQRPFFEFHKAEIFIDDQLKIPTRYAAYNWPAKAGDPEPVIEEYTYLNVKLNVGLTDADFDSENPNYNY